MNWTLGDLPIWFGDARQRHVESALAEMRRASRPDATAIIIETR